MIKISYLVSEQSIRQLYFHLPLEKRKEKKNTYKSDSALNEETIHHE